MKVLEQKYPAHKRIYYHGQPCKDSLPHLCDEFYLTPNFIYACTYAGDNGIVESYTLSKDANIFNAQSKKDYDMLQSYLEEKLPILLQYLPRLVHEDWVLGNPFNTTVKNKFIKILKELHYDGFFNYEIDKKLLQIYRENHCDYVNPVLINNPSIGIFDTSILLPIDTKVGYEDFKKEPAFLEFKEKELYFIKYRILKLYEKGLYTQENIEDEIIKLSTLLFCFKDPAEIEQLVFSWNMDELIPNKELALSTFNYLEEKTLKQYPIVRNCYTDGYYTIIKLYWKHVHNTLPTTNTNHNQLQRMFS